MVGGGIGGKRTCLGVLVDKIIDGVSSVGVVSVLIGGEGGVGIGCKLGSGGLGPVIGLDPTGGGVEGEAGDIEVIDFVVNSRREVSGDEAVDIDGSSDD